MQVQQRNNNLSWETTEVATGIQDISNKLLILREIENEICKFLVPYINDLETIIHVTKVIQFAVKLILDPSNKESSLYCFISDDQINKELTNNKTRELFNRLLTGHFKIGIKSLLSEQETLHQFISDLKQRTSILNCLMKLEGIEPNSSVANRIRKCFINNDLILDLSHYNLISIPINTLKAFSNLKQLNLYNNRISSILENSFVGLYNLEILNLSYNSVLTINSGAFEGLSKLKVLNISWNQSKTIPEESFIGLLNLEELNLSQNKIEIITNNMFLWLYKLKKLDLTFNPIKTIANEAFNNLPSMITIYFCWLNFSDKLKKVIEDQLTNNNMQIKATWQDKKLKISEIQPKLVADFV